MAIKSQQETKSEEWKNKIRKKEEEKEDCGKE